MKESRVIVDEISAVVAKVSAAKTSELQIFDAGITGVHYEHGHPIEIVETLTQLSQAPESRFSRYPIICLFQDFPETVSEAPGIDREISLHIVIARATISTLKASQRYDQNFRPILYPVYYEFLKQLAKSPAFTVKSADQIRHVKTDRLYWGREGLFKNDGNIFNDWIDCIELKDLKLKVNFKLC
jgi:hypothetical protein